MKYLSVGWSISLVYLPSSHLSAQWVGSLRLEKMVLPASCSDFIFFSPVLPSVYFKSIVKKYCRVRSIWTLQYLVPFMCWQKKKDPIAQKLSIFWSLFQFFTAQHWQEVVIHCKTPTKKAAGSKSPLIFFFVKS